MVIRRILIVLGSGVAVLALATVALAVAVVQDRPLVTRDAAPAPADVVDARAFVSGLRQAVHSSAPGARIFVTNAPQMNAVITLSERIFPVAHASLRTEGDVVLAEISIPVTPLSGRWINVSAAIPSFEDGLELRALRVGALDLPPAPVLAVLRHGGNMLLGDTLGDDLLGAARSMRIEADAIVFDMALEGLGSGGGVNTLLAALRGADMPPAELIDAFYVDLRDAMEAGALPQTGSFLPHIQHMLRAAEAGAAEHGPENAFTAAIFALTLACGTRDLSLLMGVSLSSGAISEHGWSTTCDAITLNGRIDSRRHFTTAAAIQSASNRGFAISVGEFKELYDLAEAGGFDFTDIAANNSGIRLAKTMMAAPLAAWPALIARIGTEQDVIVAFDGIPPILAEPDFTATYRDVDATSYLAQIAAIEARIDRLPLYQ